jgi:hypothetical protein
MRETSVVVALCLLLAALLAPCPSCLQAEAEAASPDAHSCCQKARQAGETHGSPASDAGDSDSCPNYGLLQTLALLKADAASDSVADTLVRLPGVRTVVASVEGAADIVALRVLSPLANLFGDLVLPNAFALVPLRI